MSGIFSDAEGQRLGKWDYHSLISLQLALRQFSAHASPAASVHQRYRMQCSFSSANCFDCGRTLLPSVLLSVCSDVLLLPCRSVCSVPYFTYLRVISVSRLPCHAVVLVSRSEVAFCTHVLCFRLPVARLVFIESIVPQ